METYLKNLHDALKKYCDIPSEQFDKFKAILKQGVLEKGELYLSAGEDASKFAFVLSGFLRLYYLSAGGDEITKDFCMKGDFAASYSSLITGKESLLYIEAMNKTRILEINYIEYQKLASSHVCWMDLDKKIAQNLYLKKEKKERDLLFLNAGERYLQFLKEYGEIIPEIKDYQIASYLGISPVSLSRIKNKLFLSGKKSYKINKG